MATEGMLKTWKVRWEIQLGPVAAWEQLYPKVSGTQQCHLTILKDQLWRTWKKYGYRFSTVLKLVYQHLDGLELKAKWANGCWGDRIRKGSSTDELGMLEMGTHLNGRTWHCKESRTAREHALILTYRSNKFTSSEENRQDDPDCDFPRQTTTGPTSWSLSHSLDIII